MGILAAGATVLGGGSYVILKRDDWGKDGKFKIIDAIALSTLAVGGIVSPIVHFIPVIGAAFSSFWTVSSGSTVALSSKAITAIFTTTIVGVVLTGLALLKLDGNHRGKQIQRENRDLETEIINRNGNLDGISTDRFERKKQLSERFLDLREQELKDRLSNVPHSAFRRRKPDGSSMNYLDVVESNVLQGNDSSTKKRVQIFERIVARSDFLKDEADQLV